MSGLNTGMFASIVDQGVNLASTTASAALDKNSYMAGAVILVASAQAAEAMKAWIQTLTFFFGNHEKTAEFLAGVLDAPYASPIADVLKTPELAGILQRGALNELPFVDMLEKLPDSVTALVKQKIGEDPLLGTFLDPAGPIGKVLGLGKNPLDVKIEALKTVTSKSLLDTLAVLVPEASVGLKELQEDGLIKQIKDVKSNLTNKWMNIKNFEELGSVVGEGLGYAKNIVSSLTNITEGFSNTIQDLLKHASELEDVASSVFKDEAFSAANTKLDAVKTELPKLTFTLLLIPPFKGGVEALRVMLASVIKEGAPGAPKFDPEAAMFPAVILFQAPFQEIVTTQYNLFASQFNIPLL